MKLNDMPEIGVTGLVSHVGADEKRSGVSEATDEFIEDLRSLALLSHRKLKNGSSAYCEVEKGRDIMLGYLWYVDCICCSNSKETSY